MRVEFIASSSNIVSQRARHKRNMVALGALLFRLGQLDAERAQLVAVWGKDRLELQY